MQDTTSCNGTSEAIAGAVRAAMARRRISQKTLRTALGWSVHYLGRRLNGEVNMSVNDLIAIAHAISADPADILTVALQDLDRTAVAA